MVESNGHTTSGVCAQNESKLPNWRDVVIHSKYGFCFRRNAQTPVMRHVNLDLGWVRTATFVSLPILRWTGVEIWGFDQILMIPDWNPLNLATRHQREELILNMNRIINSSGARSRVSSPFAVTFAHHISIRVGGRISSRRRI